ncbi:response regulator transcription factor [Dasania sp. GY-MA-18]|uniref:Response regulator transcription factor n=1 Tax=Dasania phycosphaerae TaxID=2950436 RepID=A0A9J6RJ85_9GAMM|nr:MULTISPECIES: response regulator transcription factor [Dasania]MCR8921601.1 response regulator transcription factor [Dasania sp. GY-MA-18]MCZ0864029.1 response regulator transcription factor [Dasania phycosphaerae]MCZ0867757.1 response regulator transcription factor [Dasania phycosphaerae]
MSNTTEQRHILLVDDDPQFTVVMSRAFQRRGYSVSIAHNSSEALNCIAQQNFQRAVVDLKMDKESGLQLIPQLKAAQADMDIVMLTGYSSIATAVEAVKLGALNYLCKPANIEEILKAFGDSETQPAIPDQPHSVDRLEWEHIQKVLQENNNNVSATARALGMHRRTLQRKLQKKPVKR